MMQGLAIGGGFSTSSVYLVEHAPVGKSALYGSFAMASLAFGITMGSVVFLCVYLLFGVAQTYQWAWRLPFLISGVLGVVMLLCRYNVVETESFLSGKEESKKYGFKEVLKNKNNIAYGFLLAAGDSVPFYIFAIALRTVLEAHFGYSSVQSTVMGVIIIQSYGLTALISGFLSDKFSEKKIVSLGCLAILLICVPCLYVLRSNLVFLSGYYWCVAIGFSLGMYHGSLPSLFVKMFPPRTWSVSIALSYNSGVTLFGSTAPILFSFLMTKSFGIAVMAIYVACVMLVALFALKRLNCNHPV
jgi:MFS family permease